MKSNKMYILASVAALFTSCDFFNSTVPYKGTEEDPQLVVNALVQAQDTTKIYVSRSFFFMDPNRYNRSNNTYYGGYQPLQTHTGILDDAAVSLSINHQSPKTLHYFSIQKNPTNENKAGYYTIDDLTFQPGDTLYLQVSHPLYGIVDATQICPDSIQISLVSLEMTNYAEAKIRLHIAPYHGNEDDVIYLSGKLSLAGRYSFKYQNRINVRSIKSYPSFITYLYSYDNKFWDLNTYQSDYGYCVGKHLLLPASSVRNGLDIDLIADIHVVNAFKNCQDLKCNLDTVQLSLTAMACTKEYYMYTQSLQASLDITEDYAPKLSSVPLVDNEMGDIIEEITDIFSELGGMEGYQIQCNIQGGLGHFCLATADTCHYEKYSN